MKNSGLTRAKALAFDEYYTLYETVKFELSHYTPYFANKTVYCNCDGPKSNFCLYFLRNFKKLKLKRLIVTGMSRQKLGYAQGPLFCQITDNQGYVLDVTSVKNKHLSFSRLNGNGDFRSVECLSYFKQADIIVTNPPFSLSKHLFKLCVKHRKQFLLFSTLNAVTYTSIFPLFVEKKVRIGYLTSGTDCWFSLPSDATIHNQNKSCYRVVNGWQQFKLRNVVVLTTLPVHAKLKLNAKYGPQYAKYDNYDAIDVPRIEDIPYDYDGIMGVPITILTRINYSQFELIGKADAGNSKYDLFAPFIDGKQVFKRILIKRK